MSGNDHVDALGEGARPTRRSVLAGAAGAGAAGVAATVLSGLGGADAAMAAERERSAEVDGEPDGHVVAHVRNARTGEIDVFRGTSERRLHDTDLAARIVRASSGR